MSNRRNNKLNGRELDIVTQSITRAVLTFDEALDIFIDDGKRKGLREFTLVYYRRECAYFRGYLAREDKSLLINEVVRHDVDKYVEYMQNISGLKNGTINAKLRAIRALFHFLFDKRYIAKNPMEKYSLLRERKGNIETFTVKQLQALFNSPDRRTFTGQRDYTFMLLLLETGIRLNEAAGLLVEDIKLSEGLVFIRQTKNHFHRYVPIQAKMREQLKRYIQIRGTSECNHLFVTIDDTPMSRSALQKLIGQYGKKAAIKGVRCSPHTLRHTFAKMSVMNGAGVFELQKILGHSTMEMVRTYVNLYSSDVYEKHKDFSPLNNL